MTDLGSAQFTIHLLNIMYHQEEHIQEASHICQREGDKQGEARLKATQRHVQTDRREDHLRGQTVLPDPKIEDTPD